MELKGLPHLYVEGKSDEYAITQLLMQHQIAAHAAHGKPPRKGAIEQIQIVVEYLTESEEAQSGGRDALLTGWAIALRSPVARSMGLILDADTVELHGRGLVATWKAVRQSLAADGLVANLPSDAVEDGFVGTHTGTKTPVGVWIMPDNKSEGSLEDFLLQLIGTGDPLIDRAIASTHSALDVDEQFRFSNQDLPVATLHTWLAWQRDPPMSYRTAFRNHVLQHNAIVAERLIAWVKRLTSLS